MKNLQWKPHLNPQAMTKLVTKTNNILDVSEYNVTLNNKPSAYIKFGENDENHCSLAVLNASAIKGYHTQIDGSSSLDIEVDLTCMKENNFYAMSASSDTFISIDTIDASDSNVVYKFSSKLVSTQDQSYLEFKDEILEIKGKHFTSLVQNN